MKKFAIIVSLSFVGFSGYVSAQSIEGDWTVTSGELAGSSVSQAALDAMSLKVTGNQFDAKSGESVSGGQVVTQQRDKLVFSIKSGADAGRELKAIYELRGSVLKVAFSQTDSFPTSFASTKDNNILVLNYKNNKPEAVAKKPPAKRGGRPTIGFSPASGSEGLGGSGPGK